MQKGFSSVLLLLGLVLIIALSFGGYWFYTEVARMDTITNEREWSKFFQNPSPEVVNKSINTSTLSDKDAVHQVVKNFYDWSIDCYDGMGKDGFQIENCASQKSGYVLKPVDNIFCAQNIPSKEAITIGEPTVNQSEAMVVVIMQWPTQKTSVYLGLQKVNSDWKIAELSCAKNNLDGKVWTDVQAMIVSINIYYSDHKRLPKDFNEVLNEPKNGYLKNLTNNPFNNKPYTYKPAEDGENFEVSGEQSDGSLYTQKIEVN